MSVRIGFNWASDSVPFEQAIPAMQASNADCHLLMVAPGGHYLGAGDLDTIRKVLAALPNHVKLIIRTYNRLEGDWTKYPNAAEYETHWRWVKANLGSLTERLIFDDPTNEPNLGGADSMAARVYVSRCIALLRAASNAGIKLAIGAFSVGTPHESLFETEYLPLWRALSQYKQAISMHLYGAIPFEAGETAPLDIVLDAAKAHGFMLDKQWPLSLQGYFIGRAYRIIQIFDKYGLGTPEIYATEGLVDNVLASNPSVKEAWRAKYGIDMYQRDPRGIFCWERYLKEMFPELSFDESLARLFAHARKNIFYHPAFKGLCLFALNAQWGFPSGTNKQAGSNYADPALSRFRNELLPKVNAETYGETPMNKNPLYPALIKSSVGSNIRNEAAGIDVLGTTGKLDDWTSCQLSKVSEKPGGSPYDWYEIAFNGLHGWVADTVGFEFKYEETPAPTEKFYYLDMNGATKKLTEAEYQLVLEVKRLEYEALRDMKAE